MQKRLQYDLKGLEWMVEFLLEAELLFYLEERHFAGIFGNKKWVQIILTS